MPSLFSSTRNTRPLWKDSLRAIRSDAPCRLTPSERQWLIQNDVVLILDLRTPEETAERPCAWALEPPFFYHNIPLSGGAAPASAEEAIAAYRNMADGAMWEAAALVEHAGHNVLFFCSAGKDRTGALAALLLARNGASRAEIVADYLASAENLGPELRQYAAAHPEIPLEVITPRAEYINAFLDALPF